MPEIYVSIFWGFVACPVQVVGSRALGEKWEVGPVVIRHRFSALLTPSRTLGFLSDLINGMPRSFHRSLQNAAHPSFWFLLCHKIPIAAENRDNETAQKQMCVKVIWECAACGKGEHAHQEAFVNRELLRCPVHRIYMSLKRNEFKKKRKDHFCVTFKNREALHFKCI